MKKNLILVLCCAVMIFYTSAAFSAEGMYAGGNIGGGFLSDSDVSIPDLGDFKIEYNPGIALGAALGYAFNNFRAEGEIGWQKNDLDKVSMLGESADVNGDVTNLVFLANGYYDFLNNSQFTPYVSAGIGLTNVKVSSSDLEADNDDTVFAYQVGVGIGYAVNDKVTLEVKYRYFGASDPEFDGVKVEIGSHNVLAGFRIGF